MSSMIRDLTNLDLSPELAMKLSGSQFNGDKVKLL